MSKTNGKAGTFVKNTLRKGAVTSTTTTIALAALGALEDNDPAAPLNAVSHILFGDEDAMAATGLDAKHTLSGAGLNAASVTMWAGLHELLFGRWAKKGPVEAMVSGAAVSAMAYAVDYHVVPKRLTPGFEKKLSSKGMWVTYGVLALSFAVGALIEKKMEPESDSSKSLAMTPPI